jgi:hypothetical protein
MLLGNSELSLIPHHQFQSFAFPFPKFKKRRIQMLSQISYRFSIFSLLCLTSLNAPLSFAQDNDVAPPSLLENESTPAASKSSSSIESASSPSEAVEEKEGSALSLLSPLLPFAGAFTGNAMGLALGSGILMGGFTASQVGYPLQSLDGNIQAIVMHTALGASALFALVPWATCVLIGTLVGTALVDGDSGDLIASMGGLLAGQLVGTAGVLLAGAVGAYSFFLALDSSNWKRGINKTGLATAGALQTAAVVGTIASTTLAAPLGVLGAHTLKNMMGQDSSERFTQDGLE